MKKTQDLLPKRLPEPENLDPEAAAAHIRNNGKPLADTTPDFVRTVFPNMEPRRILDIGCGNASVSVGLALGWPGSKVVAVDSCPMMAGAARSMVSRMRAGKIVDVRRARIQDGDIGAPDRSFDLVFSRSVLHHFQDPLEFWAAVRRYAKENGAIFVTDLSRPRSQAEAWQWVGRRMPPGFPEAHRNEYFRSFLAAHRPEEVLAQLDKAGFMGMRIIRTSPVHMMIFRTPK